MHRNRSSKRSRSPVIAPESSTAFPQVDGACFGKPDAKEDDAPITAPKPEEPAAPPALPSFLAITEAGKYPSTKACDYRDTEFAQK